MYTAIKLVHQFAVGISIAGFVVRWLGMLNDAAWLQGRAARTLPHVVDTILLASAVALVWMLDISIFRTTWIAAKIVALVVYIVLGSIALKHGRSRPARVVAGLAAMTVFGYIVSVALTRNPGGFLAVM